MISLMSCRPMRPLFFASSLLMMSTLPAILKAELLASKKNPLSASVRSQITSLASSLIRTQPALAADIAAGRVFVDTSAVDSVVDLYKAINSPKTHYSGLRLRGGFTAMQGLSSLVKSNRPASSINELHIRPLSFGKTRLRGGCKVTCRAVATDIQHDNADVIAPPPECISASGEMPPQYDSKLVEQPLYEWWEKCGFFKPKAYVKGEKKSYVLPMPPPNVTGGLHMGHAMFVALQDILARFHRMRGEPTLWLPGTDHAGIATQLLVERALKAEGVSRYDLGRDKFLERVWAWKAEKGGYITQQLRRLGASADWSRERFTMDEGLSQSVVEAFVQLHEKGLVYRGEYMVNWSPNLRTAVSDLEVEYSEEMGKLYYFKYRLEGGGDADFLPVATTRPETILGDTAVCVHPDDPRYQKYIGKKVVVPFQGRSIPVIADTYVDMEFGTGCLKITPGHDPNDYELGKKHGLPTINIMNRDATLNDNAGGEFVGMDRFAARERVWASLESAGLAIEAKPHMQRVPRSQRGGEVIEPLVSTQWFVKTEGMARRGVEWVRSGRLKIIPERFEKTWFNWMENIHDWCVSRQLWWGHRIPVWHVLGTGDFPQTTAFVVARSEEDAYAQARAKHGDAVELRQDDDVLDTWFSSGLWPFSTVGWPRQAGGDDPSSDFQRFYAGRGQSCLETGYDILFFWVARMVMLGGELTGDVPFDTVYMHGLVRDAEGKKMSKTTGNVVDPLDAIAQYGTDALRYTLATGVTPGQDVPLDPRRIEANRNFANKLWNSARFILGNLKGLSPEELAALAVARPMSAEDMSALAVPERHVVSLCHRLVGDVTRQLDEYVLGQAGDQVQTFLWDEFADWYLEASKVRLFAAQKSDDPAVQAEAAAARRVLVYVLDTALRLLHPFMPYVTEALWQRLPHAGPSLMIAPWPQAADAAPLHVDEQAVAQFRAMQALVRAVRNARAEYRVEPGKKIAALVGVENPALLDTLRRETRVFSALVKADESAVRVETLAAARSEQEASAAAAAAAGGGKAGPKPVQLVVQDGLEAFLPMAGMVDLEKEAKRLTKQRDQLAKEVEGLERRLSAPGFAGKAPPEVVAEATQALQEKREQLATVTAALGDVLAAK